MNVLLRNCKILSPGSPSHGQTSDILIKNGKVAAMGKSLKAEKNIREIKGKGLHLSPGWFDMYAGFCDPGYEYKEDLQSGMAAAAAGGFTGVAVKPDTLPVVHSKGEVEYIINKARSHLVDVFPLGAISRELKGKEITEMYDMHGAGAIGFSDADHAMADAGLMLRALQYVKPFNGVVYSYPVNPTMEFGEINESEVSVRMGMKGSPALAEELMVHRDCYLAKYVASNIHFAKISTKGAVDLIRKERKGAGITAAVAAYHLLLSETSVESYDANYKTKPPLRSKEDINALVKGIKDGTIDAICSDHTPQDVEAKIREFEFAHAGMINLQTAFSVAWTALQGKVPIEKMVQLLAVRPREILKLELPVIAEGARANFTIFDPGEDWVLEENKVLSKSRNSPFIGRQLKGKVIGTINNKQVFLNQ